MSQNIDFESLQTRRFECFNEGCRAEFISAIKMDTCPYCETHDIYEMD